MAMQLSAVIEARGGAGDSLSNWRAYHFFYHADRDLLLRRLAGPLLAELVRAGAIDRFFFVRYSLGGPHVRLRWRVTGPAGEAAAEDALARRTAAFLDRWPSPAPLPERRVREVNRMLLLDPMTRPEEDVVYPDNTWLPFPAEFEVERYGGPGRLPASLDLFTVSSALVLRMLAEHEGARAGWIRTAMLRLILRMAWSFTRAGDSALLALVGYGERFMGDRFAPCLQHGDAAFERQSARLENLVRGQLEAPFAGDELAAACGRVAAGLGGLAEYPQWYLAASHIHMTANRLGVANSDEAYLSRMLWRAVEAVRCADPGAWNRLWNLRPPPPLVCDPAEAVLEAFAREA